VSDCASAISSSESEFTTTGGCGGGGGGGCDAADGTPTGADTDAGGATVVCSSVGARLMLIVSLSAIAVVAGVGFVAARLTLTVSLSVIAVSIDSTVSGVSSARLTLIVSLSVNALISVVSCLRSVSGSVSVSTEVRLSVTAMWDAL